MEYTIIEKQGKYGIENIINPAYVHIEIKDTARFYFDLDYYLEIPVDCLGKFELITERDITDIPFMFSGNPCEYVTDFIDGNIIYTFKGMDTELMRVSIPKDELMTSNVDGIIKSFAEKTDVKGIRGDNYLDMFIIKNYGLDMACQ